MSVNPIVNRINNVIVPIVLASSERSCNFFNLIFTTRGAVNIIKSCKIRYKILASTLSKIPEEIVATGSK